MSRAFTLVARLARWLVYATGFVLLLAGAALIVVQTDWARDRLRRLVVRQANEYLTATLDIGRLSGSLFQGIELHDVTLSRDGQPIVAIDDVLVRYGIRELIGQGTIIRELHLTGLRLVAKRESDGRWNLASLVKPRPASRPSGPRRPIQIQSITIGDGSIAFQDPWSFGAVHVPTAFDHLDAKLSLETDASGWRTLFQHVSWTGRAPELTVKALTGGLSDRQDGWAFDDFKVETPRSLFTLNGRVDAGPPASRLHLNVNAERFSFQEWSGVLSGLTNLAVDAAFQAKLDGPLNALATELTLKGNGGDVGGAFVLDTMATGWRGKGAVEVARLDLARWLNRLDRPSNISGKVSFDLTDIGLKPGGKFPLGKYEFNGPHAEYLDYKADNVKARGDLIASEARIAAATLDAYGAGVTLRSGAIGIDAPYPYTFAGMAQGVDLRALPSAVPVPHVASLLDLGFDVSGQFASPVIRGRADFDDSTFLGANLAAGAVGSIDTFVTPFRYAGEGDLTGVDLHRFGVELGVEWLQEPRYAGAVDGHFRVDGSGSELATMTLDGGGRISRAAIFGGQLRNGDVTIGVQSGSLVGSYDGAFSTLDPAIALQDDRFAASLSGSGRATVSVHDMLVRTPALQDYSTAGNLTLTASRVGSLTVDRADLSASLAGGTLSVTSFHGVGPQIDLEADGSLELDGTRSSRLNYNVTRGDLSLLKDATGQEIVGDVVTSGQLTGPSSQLHVVGSGTVGRVVTNGVTALDANVQYDATMPLDRPADVAATVKGRLAVVEGFGQQVKELAGTIDYDRGRIKPDLQLQIREVPGRLAGTFVLNRDQRTLDIETLALALRRSAWQLAPASRARVSWDTRGFALAGLTLVDTESGTQHLNADGTFTSGTPGGGAARITASGLSIDALASNGEGPARYGGTADLDVTLGGFPAHPDIKGRLSITDGRIWRVAYDKLAGRLDYVDGALKVDLRLDQRPGVWLTAVGTVPLGIVDATMPEGPYDLALASSSVDLGLVEGLTNVVRDVTGQINLNVRVLGTTHDPHFAGHVELTDVGFIATTSGARYKGGHAALGLATDRITMESFHLEDSDGDPLEASGSLGTHELRVGDLQLSVNARSFNVLRNEFGHLDINARVELTGAFESPHLSGRISVSSGELNVDTILDHTMLQAYAPQASGSSELDAIAAINPWDRLTIDLELNVPNTLRLVGDNVQLTPGTPLGLGNINLRALGDLYLYKGTQKPLYVMGSLDSVTGTYAFQGKRFDLDPTSSINFRGDLTPEVYVMVTRDINGVEARVTIAGPLDAPELRLSSTPVLEASDILSLIVFNTSANELSALQQQQLAVRAGTLAAGFLAAPMMGALERSLGLDTFEIEPGADIRTGARVTVGNEIAPGLFARFSRQFGEDQYDAATIEYYLSRILRLRATFSDAGVTRSPFRRVERAGVDLLLFFSF